MRPFIFVSLMVIFLTSACEQRSDISKSANDNKDETNAAIYDPDPRVPSEELVVVEQPVVVESETMPFVPMPFGGIIGAGGGGTGRRHNNGGGGCQHAGEECRLDRDEPCHIGTIICVDNQEECRPKLHACDTEIFFGSRDFLLASVNTAAISMAYGDVNDDGLIDIVTANFSTNDFSVLLNIGEGTYGPPTNYPSGGVNPNSVGLADLDRDGDLDVAITNSNDNVVIFFNNGQGIFVEALAPNPYPVGSLPISLAIADLDGINGLDIAVANFNGNSASVLLNNGNGTFSPAVNYPVGTNPVWVSLGDVNNDGKIDMITANNASNDISVLFGNGDGTFQTATPYSAGAGTGPEAMALGDLNQDGFLDVVTANFGNNTVSILLNQENGAFVLTSSLPLAGLGFRVAVGDVNKDEKLDMVVTVYNPSLGLSVASVYFGNGDGTFQTPTDYITGTEPAALVLAPVALDGLDIVTGNALSGDITVILNQGNGTYISPANYPTGGLPNSVALGDLNGDKYADMVVANLADDTVSIYLNNGDKTFGTATTLAAGARPIALALGDLNNDDNEDIVVADFISNQIAVLLGNGDGSFQPATFTNVGTNPKALALGDINGDQNLDAVVANQGGSSISVLLGDGLGGFSSTSTILLSASPTSIALSNVDQDLGQTLDIVTANPSGSTVSVLLGNGDGTFNPAIDFPAGNTPQSLAVGDIDGILGPDIVVANQVNGFNNVSLLLNNGNGTFGSRIAYQAGFLPTFVALGDVDGNGSLDAVIANRQGANISVLLNFAGVFQSPINYTVGQSPIALALGSLGGRGLDLVVVNLTSNTATVLLNIFRPF